MRYIAVSLFLLLCQLGYAKNYKVTLGDTPVVIQYTKGCGKTFVHLHHNETTALAAAKAVIRKQGGSLITLVHPGGRTIVFKLNKQRYEFDPNRIFTDIGIKKTLKRYGNYSPAAKRQVKKLALKIERLLPKGKIIAVHNNADYSLKNYLPGHDMATDARALHQNPHRYYRNFYLVTRPWDHTRFTIYGFNSILQKPTATDDGSLSIFLSRRNYINVEAGYDQLAEQINMLKRA